MPKEVYRVASRGADGEIRIRDYLTEAELLRRHIQVGVDDCSTNLSLRGYPVFRGLVGPMADGQGVVRYESPDVFEVLTKEWATPKKRTRTRKTAAETAAAR
ncbi:MAG: hypothetical protein ACRC46_02810 [Thermoguttaceae bacterium]